MTFKTGTTYCESCLEVVDPSALHATDGYTPCCNELPVDARQARRLDREYAAEETAEMDTE